MKTCKHCGNHFDKGLRCPQCGHSALGKAKEWVSRPAADTTDTVNPNDVTHNQIYAYLSYVGPLFLVGLLAAPNSKFARFHANQGLALLLSLVIYGLLYAILALVSVFLMRMLAATLIVPVVFGLVLRILRFGFLLFFAGVGIGLWNVWHGRAKELPIIGKIRILK